MTKLPTHLKAINLAIILGTAICAALIYSNVGYMSEAYPVYLIFLVSFISNPLALCSLLNYAEDMEEHDKYSIINLYMCFVTGLSLLLFAMIIVPLIMTPQGEVTFSGNVFSSVMCLLAAYVMMITSYFTLKKIVMSKDTGEIETGY